jgi:FHS family L-fucose permease-like MFS transporter
MTNSNTVTETNYSALTTLTTVFFFWGFIAAGNSIFIPFCKNYFSLDQFQAQLIDFAFYLAYFLGALGLFAAGSSSGKDIVGSWGYKKSIIYGLLFSALGAGAMIVSVYLNTFAGMLLGLFTVALGFSLQQTSTNPFMISLGDPKTGSNRINLGGAVNSLGTTLGPLIIALALFGSAGNVSDDMIASLSLNKVIILYACVGVLFLGIAFILNLNKKVPSGISSEVPEKANKALYTLLTMTLLLGICFAPVFNSYVGLEKDDIATNAIEMNRMLCLAGGIVVVVGCILFARFASSTSEESAKGWGAMKYPQLTMGMLAIFLYVGVEVAIGSNLGELLKQKAFGGYEASEIAPFVAMFWGSLMIGRWVGSVNVFPISDQKKMILKFIVPFVAFGVVMGATYLADYEIGVLKWYFICIIIQIVAFLLTKDKPALTLSVFSALGLLAVIISLKTTGLVSVYALLSCGLACSIMWPCIFSLATAGLGKYTSQGAGFLVMMILGGAIIPPIQGKLADLESVGIQNSFIIGGLCFAYLIYYAWSARRSLLDQNIDFES